MRPNDILPEEVNQVLLGGVPVRKGSVGAFLSNARVVVDPNATPEARAVARAHIEEIVPALDALGLFAILEIRDPEIRGIVEHARGAASAPAT